MDKAKYNWLKQSMDCGLTSFYTKHIKQKHSYKNPLHPFKSGNDNVVMKCKEFQEVG